LDGVLSHADVDTDGRTLLKWSSLSIFSVMSVAIVLRHALSGLSVLATCFMLAAVYLARRSAKKVQLLRTQSIDFADGLSDSLSAGHSLSQAVLASFENPKEPLGGLIEEMVGLINYGFPADVAFEKCARETSMSELHTLAAAIRIQYQSGGNIRNVLAEFSSQMRQNLLFEQNLKTQTAQGRLSVRVVGFVPPLLAIAMNFLMPGYFSAFLADPTGRILFYLAVGLDLVGLLAVRNIMRISIS
jgi:tight adherence protein B